MQVCCARGPACRASCWAPSRHAPARAGTGRRSRASTRTRARDSTGAHAHARICAHIRTHPSPPARAPTRAARLSGGHAAAVVVGGGASDGGRLSPRRLLVGREELRRTQPGTARCGGALRRGCRRLLRSLGLEGRLASDGSARHGKGAHRCVLTRTRHAWVVRRLERGSAGHAAP